MNGKKLKKTCGSDLESKEVPLKHKLVLLFWTLGPAFTRWAESHHAQQGLTPQRMRLSELLFDNGPTKMCDLRDALGVTATNITALVDALEKDGIVERVAHATDRRVTLIKLTPKAHKTIQFGCTQFKDKVSGLFDDFSAGEQEQFFKLLKKMRHALVEREVLEISDLQEQKDEARA
ncbi:MAG: MarR family winged helix-turn-helix transcriptional regulator [Bdellovibrionota bacterium]